MGVRPILLALPEWAEECLRVSGARALAPDERMRLVIRLSALNVERGTGGPFAAAVFEQDTGRLLAAGVNLVVPLGCSVWHAEIVALAFAQQAAGSYDLGADGAPARELVASTEPCAMCMGAIPWSGVRRLVCGARGEDACALGFDEGAKPADWVDEFERRGITVRRDVCREEAVSVLRRYAERGGPVYNPRRVGWNRA